MPITISYPTRASGIIVLLKALLKYRKLRLKFEMKTPENIKRTPIIFVENGK